ncbi:recombinase family protein [Companilactobacillus sp. DQM5]|uniref:recombinase family protein n=1 Tax=Companilactobacillus sp. DQM5 TaxID=3463359 RepID=UPI004059EB9A
MTKIIAYCRTSTNKQDLGIDVQLRAIEVYNPDKIYKEQVSGRKENRKELHKALSNLDTGDTLLIYKLDRLSRSTKQLVNIMAELNEKGIHLTSISDGVDTSTPNGRFLFTIMSAMAQLEAEMISQRTKEALAITTKKLGRPRIKRNKIQRVIHLYKNTKLTIKEIAIREKISDRTIYRILKEYNLKRN